MVLSLCVPQSVDELEEVLVRCQDLWWRSPGSGASPFAKDGPWYLAQGEVGDVKGHYSETLLVNEAGRELLVRKVDSPRPRVALDAGEVDERDRVTAWLGQVADVPLRRAIWLMAGYLARDDRVGWTAIARQVGWTRTADALARACRREMALLVCRLNDWPTRRARVLAGREAGLAEVRERPAMVVAAGDAAA